MSGLSSLAGGQDTFKGHGQLCNSVCVDAVVQ